MEKDEWLTPPELLAELGPFDLDPCSPGDRRPWDTAKEHWSLADGDSLLREWYGRVWMNPPYGKEAARWMQKLADHGNGIALIFARTETAMFFDHIWGKADAVLFIRGRISFYHVDGRKADNNGGAPSCLVAYGEDNANVLSGLPHLGHVVRLDWGRMLA
jgi:hypothetical protein